MRSSAKRGEPAVEVGADRAPGARMCDEELDDLLRAISAAAPGRCGGAGGTEERSPGRGYRSMRVTCPVAAPTYRPAPQRTVRVATG